MGWLKHRWSVLREALGFRRFLVVPIFGTCAGIADWFAARLGEAGVGNLIGVPSWAIGVFAATLLVLWWVIEYAVKLRKQISGVRVGLSKLREEGVTLRNSGRIMFQEQSDYATWKTTILDWNTRVIAEIRKINEADAVWFSILDVVEPPRIPMIQIPPAPRWLDDHKKHYGEHDFRLSRLGEMIQNLWRDQ